jgi:hemerythrin superfamily protein
MRRNESVACDIVYSDTPAVADSSTAAVIFVGIDTQVTDIYGIKTDKQFINTLKDSIIKTDKQFINTLEDSIIQRGAPNKLISDRAQVIFSIKVLDNLCT